jgi:hypothetical protein
MPYSVMNGDEKVAFLSKQPKIKILNNIKYKRTDQTTRYSPVKPHALIVSLACTLASILISRNHQKLKNNYIHGSALRCGIRSKRQAPLDALVSADQNWMPENDEFVHSD